MLTNHILGLPRVSIDNLFFYNISLGILDKQISIWVVGSSIIKEAFVQARSNPGGLNMGLQILKVSVWWQGRSGMGIDDLKKQINIMLRYEDKPKFLVLHVGVNDIGRMKTGDLREELKSKISWVKRICQIHGYCII